MRSPAGRIGITAVWAATLLAAACDRSPDPRLVKVGVTHGPSHSFTKALERFGENLHRRTHGRYEVRVYCSSQLGSEKELQEMLTIGSAEMTVTGVLNTYEPMFAIFELPYLYRDRSHVMRVNTGPIMREVADSLVPKGLRLIGFYENGFRHVTNSVRPVNDPSDLHGLKIRTPENPAEIETFKALGAIPTPLPFSELYSALLQKVVDGQENPLQNIWHGHLFEAQQHLAMTGHIYNSAYVVVSERFWKTLPESDRQAFAESLIESSRWQLNYMQRRDQELEQELKDHGVAFTHPDQARFRQACRPAYEAIFARLGPRSRHLVTKIRESATP